nr:MarR family transcriptional regulator [Microlunatus panaciterrae]
MTAQRYQLLLALKGFPGRDWASVSELAERLQVRHHSVVELVDRTEQQGLVQRASHPDDARAVRVQLTRSGEQALARLDQLHRDELRRIGVAFRTLQWDALLEQDGGDGDRPAPERRTGR